MELADLVLMSEELAEQMDSIVESVEPIERQALADSVWYRLCSVNGMVRDEGGGAVAASMARSLLEQAAYWDWATAVGIGEQHVAMWAGLEWRRLEQIARSVDDDVWLGWLLPPGAQITVPEGLAIPRNSTDAVKRLGHGLDEAVLAPLQFKGIVAAYRLLGVLAHSNLVAAALLFEGRGHQLPDRLAAIVVHVAAAGAVAVVSSIVPTEHHTDRLVASARELAEAAATIHGLETGAATKSQRVSKPVRANPESLSSVIMRMPTATQDVTGAAVLFVAAADKLTEAVFDRGLNPIDGAGQIAAQSFLLALSHLDILRGTLDDRLGRALLPFSARALFEEGARWEWLQLSAARNPTGDSLRALVAASLSQRDRIRENLRSDGVDVRLIDDLLGPISDLQLPELGTVTLPGIDQMLSQTHRTASGVESSRAIYGVLSQFVHATPLSILHIQRDEFPSLSAPTWAISVEAACRGFERLATVSLLLADLDPDSLEVPLRDLQQSAVQVIRTCAIYHCLG